MSATIQRERGRVDTRDAELIASEAFARVFRAYIECSEAAQEAIRDMVEIVNDPEATADERDAALLTIAEALFPSPGADLEECETRASDDVRTELDAADSQEATFADRLGSLLKERNMTQSELGDRIGVGQSAISMMLSRNCRPQRGTVKKIADALEVQPSDLWPAYEEA